MIFTTVPVHRERFYLFLYVFHYGTQYGFWYGCRKEQLFFLKAINFLNICTIRSTNQRLHLYTLTLPASFQITMLPSALLNCCWLTLVVIAALGFFLHSAAVISILLVQTHTVQSCWGLQQHSMYLSPGLCPLDIWLHFLCDRTCT